ncbi:MAG TPA: GNAT family N-acetyltransferase [Verrucomicrobiales bacterium]|nr:GNAT family N-acetyltransferase [Verrucomicrobiales bacterium]
MTEREGGWFAVGEASWEEAQQELLGVRRAVFIEEQGVAPEIEIDGKDPLCRHVRAWAEDGLIIGTARIEADGHIGRVAVLLPWRRRGVGRAMMETLAAMAQEAGLQRVYLNAQVEAAAFYRGLGYHGEGEEFLEAGIPHRRMSRTLGMGR